MTDIFSAPGTFWRGNLHTHSTLSDGVLAPEEVCRRYKAEGYDFLALTDHFIGFFNYPIADTLPFRDDSFTTILGAEIHSGAMQNGELWHILAVGLPADFAPSNSPDFAAHPDQETGPELAARARAAGAFVAVAHPQWSGMTLDDARSIEAAHAVEIYNHGCAMGCDRPTWPKHDRDRGATIPLCQFALDPHHRHGQVGQAGLVKPRLALSGPDRRIRHETVTGSTYPEAIPPESLTENGNDWN